MNAVETKEIEEQVIRRAVADLLTAGYSISVFDGESYTVRRSMDAEEIIGALWTTDEEYLMVYYGGRRIGFVQFVYGNDGWDVIADNSCSLEDALKGASDLAQAIADAIGRGDFEAWLKTGDNAVNAARALAIHDEAQAILREAREVFATPIDAAYGSMFFGLEGGAH